MANYFRINYQRDAMRVRTSDLKTHPRNQCRRNAREFLNFKYALSSKRMFLE